MLKKKFFANFNTGAKNSLLFSIIKERKPRLYKKEVAQGMQYRILQFPLPYESDLDSEGLALYETELDNINSEFQIQQSLSSDFIIEIKGKLLEKKRVTVVFQPFQCLLSQISIGSLSFQERFRIFQSILAGVQVLVKKKICHTCISPDHIYLVKNNNLQMIGKINYFKNALPFQKNLKSREIIIEINDYSAPQLRYSQCCDSSIDIWSLGAILNYLLYQTISNIWIEGQQVKIEVPEGTPDWLLQLLKSMLHFNPQRRYQIGTIKQIWAACGKCLEVLSKTLPLGKKNLSLNGRQSKLRYQL